RQRVWRNLEESSAHDPRNYGTENVSCRPTYTSVAGTRLCASHKELSEVRRGSDGRIRCSALGRSVCGRGSVQGDVSRMARRLLLCGQAEGRPIGRSGALICFALVDSRSSRRLCLHLCKFTQAALSLHAADSSSQRRQGGGIAHWESPVADGRW